MVNLKMESVSSFEDYFPAYSPDYLLSVETMLLENPHLPRSWEFQIVEAVVDELGYAWPARFVAKAIVTRLLTNHCCTFLDCSALYKLYVIGQTAPVCPHLTSDNRIAVANKMPTFLNMFHGIIKSVCKDPDFRGLKPSALRDACCAYIKQCHCQCSGHPQLPWDFKEHLSE